MTVRMSHHALRSLRARWPRATVAVGSGRATARSDSESTHNNRWWGNVHARLRATPHPLRALNTSRHWSCQRSSHTSQLNSWGRCCGQRVQWRDARDVHHCIVKQSKRSKRSVKISRKLQQADFRQIHNHGRNQLISHSARLNRTRRKPSEQQVNKSFSSRRTIPVPSRATRTSRAS